MFENYAFFFFFFVTIFHSENGDFYSIFSFCFWLFAFNFKSALIVFNYSLKYDCGLSFTLSFLCKFPFFRFYCCRFCKTLLYYVLFYFVIIDTTIVGFNSKLKCYNSCSNIKWHLKKKALNSVKDIKHLCIEIYSYA